MKTLATLLVCVFALGAASTASAQTHPDTAARTPHAQSAVTASPMDVPDDAQPAVRVVNDFGRALAAGDLNTVATLLDARVLILESGGAQRSRAEYLEHHAPSDARFLGSAQVNLRRRTARVEGVLAWVASESEIRTARDGKPLTLLSTETMVLRHNPAGWRIVHIHWSSRPHQGNGETP